MPPWWTCWPTAATPAGGGRRPTLLRPGGGGPRDLFVDARRVGGAVPQPTISRKVNNLPTQVYATGAMASIKAKIGSKAAKQVDYEAIQERLAAYNAETGSTAGDLARHGAVLVEIATMVNAWCAAYGKDSAGDLMHAKQRYMVFDLKRALVEEEKANGAVVPDAPKGAERGVRLPGSPVLPSPAPPRALARPEVKEVPVPAPVPVRPGHRSPPPLPAFVPGRVDSPAPPVEDEPLTQFQLEIQHVYTTLEGREATTEEDIAAWAFIQDLHSHINEFGTSIMRLSDSKESKEAPGSVATRLKVTAILASIRGGDNRQLRKLLEIPPVDEKDVGLSELSAKLGVANQAIADLGAITPEIAATFSAAAVTTGRIAMAKGLTGIAVGVGMGAVPVPGVGHAFSMAKAIRTVASTIKHIRRLQKIQLMAKAAGNDDLVDMLDYIIAKKQAKTIKAASVAFPSPAPSAPWASR